MRIGSRSKRQRRNRRIVLLLLLHTVFTIWLVQQRLPHLENSLRGAALRSYAQNEIATAVHEAQRSVQYSTETQQICFDAYRLSVLKAELIHRIDRKLSTNVMVWIPIGSFSDCALLHGWGYSVPVFFSVISTSDVQFTTALNSAGINNPQYTVQAEITVHMYPASAENWEPLTFTTVYPLFEALQYGEVPGIRTYTVP